MQTHDIPLNMFNVIPWLIDHPFRNYNIIKKQSIR